MAIQGPKWSLYIYMVDFHLQSITSNTTENNISILYITHVENHNNNHNLTTTEKTSAKGEQQGHAQEQQPIGLVELSLWRKKKHITSSPYVLKLDQIKSLYHPNFYYFLIGLQVTETGPRAIKKKSDAKQCPLSFVTVASKFGICFCCVRAAGESFEVVYMINDEWWGRLGMVVTKG